MSSSLKSDIRTEKLTLRMQMDAKVYTSSSQLINLRLEEVLKPDSRKVAIFHPVRNEPDISHFITRDNICLPVVVPGSRQLLFRRVMAGQVLQKNKYGIMQPPEEAESCSPDIVIVPMAAFDRKGHRIGYGGGYYDTTLASLRKQKNIIAIGVAFSFQEVTPVPAEAFDEKLDMVITEKETMSFA